jgi:hypothetical protein
MTLTGRRLIANTLPIILPSKFAKAWLPEHIL